MEIAKNKNVKKIGEIKLTHDLDQFKFMTSNRPINPKHVDNIRRSVKEHGPLVNPIMVNSKKEVIDGQNRLSAFRKENQPIYYYEVPGYNINEVRILNIKQRNWTNMDYLRSYVEMGYEDYITLYNFYKQQKDFSLSVCIALLSNSSSYGQFSEAESLRRKSGKKEKIFNRGTWKVKDYEMALDDAIKLKSIGHFYDGYNKSIFIGTMLTLIHSKSEFEFDEFMHKLKLQPSALRDCSNRVQYREIIEKIYNHRRKDKINLKY